MIKKVFLLFCSLLALSALADELVVVKAVSDSKKTFVIKKGFEDGIRVGQKRVFSTDKISLVARALETKSTISLWEIVEDKGVIPFKYEDVIVFSATTESVWTDINRIKENLKIAESKKSLSLSDRTAYVIKGSMSRGVAESSDGTSTGLEITRTGMQIEGLYSREFEGYWARSFELSGGLRLDREATKIKSDTDVDILTTRILGVAELTYNFTPSEKLGGNFYASLGAGYGRSSSSIDNTTSAGPTLLLPSVKIGFCSYFDQHQILMEGGIEALSSNESFTDAESQKTTLINSKLTLGVRF